LHVITTGMKKITLQQYKEVSLVCEKGIFEAKAISNMLIPLLQTVPEKTKMYCTNYHKTNHNVETCRVKIKEDHVPTFFEVTIQHIKI